MQTQKPLIVVCDDEELIRWSLCEHLEAEGYLAHATENGQQAVDAVRDHSPAAVILDLRMPVLDGLSALRKIRESGSDVPVVMITAHGAVDSAIEATRLGAAAYLTKPFDLREVSLAIKKALEVDRLRQEVHFLRDRRRGGYGDFVGTSKCLDPMFEILRRLETVDVPTILISGESGTGKDVVARMIHARGPKKERPFVDIDCASLTETLIESELFGHERGAFTDARQTKRGLFEVAGNGIVFLDEIGEMSLATQAKFLRALESRRFKRVGGTATLTLDASVIAATNRDLKEEVKHGRFREDLFFRLNVIPMRIPALRERNDDIPLLVGHFLERYARQFGRPIEGVTGPAMQLLQQYAWPGNVRELRNVLERMVILGPNPRIAPEDLPAEIRFGVGASSPASASAPTPGCPFELPEEGVDLEAVERGLLAQALARTQGNQSAAARLLGITRYALRYRMEKFGIGA